MTIFVYLCSGLPERQGSKMSSVTGEGIGRFHTSNVLQGQEIVPQSDPESHEFVIILREADFMSDGTCTLEIILVRSNIVDAPKRRTAGWYHLYHFTLFHSADLLRCERIC